MSRRQQVRFIKFRIYPGRRDGHGMYVQVRIFATHREMLIALRAEGRVTGDRYANKTDGVMQSFKRQKVKADGSVRTAPIVGVVSLYKRRLSTEVVVHEFAHAAFAWAARKRLTGDFKHMAVEEQFCYALGRMVARFVRRAVKLGLYAD
jgi:hypothetical protein